MSNSSCKRKTRTRGDQVVTEQGPKAPKHIQETKAQSHVKPMQSRCLHTSGSSGVIATVNVFLISRARPAARGFAPDQQGDSGTHKSKVKDADSDEYLGNGLYTEPSPYDLLSFAPVARNALLTSDKGEDAANRVVDH